MGSMPSHSFTALRTLEPPAQAPIVAAPRFLSGGKPLRGRSAIFTLLIVAAAILGGLLIWWAYFSPVPVSVAPVQADIREQVFGLGTVGARVQSNVGFKVAGVLVALKADQGDRVQAGQLLAQLDARDVEAQLALAKAGVAQALANIDKSKSDVVSAAATLENAQAVSTRRNSLVEKGFASVEEAQTNEAVKRVATANLASAKSGVRVADATLQSAEAQEAFEQATLANYSLYAPYDAWIVSRNLELGSMPNPGQSVFTLVAANTVWAVSYVDERLAGRLANGQPAEIVLRSNLAASIPGHVERIEAQSDAVNEERLVDVAFDKIPADIHLAEQAEVRITTGVLPSAVVVPPSAVSDLKDGRGQVWTVRNGRLERAEVTVGSELLDGRLPILAGVPDDAAVVATPVPGMHAGRAAKVTNAITR